MGSLHVISLVLAGSYGGAATPPYQFMLGLTCWPAVAFRKQAQ